MSYLFRIFGEVAPLYPDFTSNISYSSHDIEAMHIQNNATVSMEIQIGGDSMNSDLSSPSLLVASRSLRIAQLISF